MGIIDFRVRPLYGGYRALADNGTAERFLTAFRCEPSPSILQRSMELLVREMDEAGVELAVVPGRASPATRVTNEELMEVAQKWPGRFFIFPLYDPMGGEESLEQVKDLVLHGGCRGVSIEPGMGNSLRFDSEAYQPLYRWMNERGTPLLTTFSGSITPVIDQTLPSRFHAMARRYPDMAFIAGHAGWPWLRELFSMAFFTGNIYLLPDLYSFNCPGEEDVRLAADNILRDRMLFGSSYPLLTVGGAVEHVKGWGLREDSQRLLFHDNGAKLLGL